MRHKLIVYSPHPNLTKRVAERVRALCASRKTAKAVGHGRVQLNSALTERLVAEMIEAAGHAALRSIPDKVRHAGAPADNSRIILAQDIEWACTGLGLSAELRYVPPRSLVVDLYAAVAPLIWPHDGEFDLNPRSTFERMQDADIVRN